MSLKLIFFSIAHTFHTLLILLYLEDITRWCEDMNFISEWQNNFCHLKIKLISSSCRVMFFLLYRQNDINKIIEGNYQNYVIDKLTCEIMENKLRTQVPDVVFVNLQVVYFPVKHSCLYNKYIYIIVV